MQSPFMLLFRLSLLRSWCPARSLPAEQAFCDTVSCGALVEHGQGTAAASPMAPLSGELRACDGRHRYAAGDHG
jgi:hypothetical protein